MSRQDDGTLVGKLILWRRIPPSADRVIWDLSTGEPRPSSMNFRDRMNELSLFIASESTTDCVLAGHDGFGLVAITAGEIRKIVPQAVLARDPDPDPALVVACGRITHGQSAQLAKLCRWEIKPSRNPAANP